MLCHHAPPPNLKFLPGVKRVRQTPKEPKHDLGIIVDLDSTDRLGGTAPYFEACRRIIVVDHHVPHEAPGDLRIIETSAAATALIGPPVAQSPTSLQLVPTFGYTRDRNTGAVTTSSESWFLGQRYRLVLGQDLAARLRLDAAGFLLHFQQSIAQACGLLRSGGSLLISFYEGFFDSEGRDAMSRAFPDMTYRFGAVRLEDLLECLGANPLLTTKTIDYRFEVEEPFLIDFLTIPAQSAGLFPKVPYEDRIGPIRDLVGKLTAEVRPLFMGWKFLISTKK